MNVFSRCSVVVVLFELLLILEVIGKCLVKVIFSVGRFVFVVI